MIIKKKVKKNNPTDTDIKITLFIAMALYNLIILKKLDKKLKKKKLVISVTSVTQHIPSIAEMGDIIDVNRTKMP